MGPAKRRRIMENQNKILKHQKMPREVADVDERNSEGLTHSILQRSEARYRRLFETAQDGILILDAQTGQVVDANPFMQVLLGYSLEEFLGKKLWEVGP